MASLSQAVEALTVLAAGLLVRVGLAFLLLAVIAALMLLGLSGWRRLRGVYDWGRGIRVEGGLRYRRGLVYLPGHVWLRRGARSSRLTLGLDDVAQRILAGDLQIRLPESGRQLRAGESLVEIGIGGRRAQVRAPLAGRVRSSNSRLARHPDLLHTDPYGRAWLVRMQDAGGAVPGARVGTAAQSWLAEEYRRLTRYVEWHLGLAGADGGEPYLPTAQLLEEREWQHLVETFLVASPPPEPGDGGQHPSS
ncbi:MAG: glycine cleavage system protein H [Vicinamibacteria bacterium]